MLAKDSAAVDERANQSLVDRAEDRIKKADAPKCQSAPAEADGNEPRGQEDEAK